MAGSKSESLLVLLYDTQEDKASWAIKSYAMLVDNATYGRYQVIWENAPNYNAVAALAGNKPSLVVEEVTQLTKEDNEEEGNNSNVVYSDNLTKRK